MEYEFAGNEELKPLAIGGSVKAVAELKKRGNVLIEGEILEKTRKRTRHNYLDGKFVGTDHIVETVHDGRLVSRTVNGKEMVAAIPEA